MPGDLVTFDLSAAIMKQAAVERDRIIAILAAIDERHEAGVAVQDETLSEAGEYLAVKRLPDASAPSSIGTNTRPMPSRL